MNINQLNSPHDLTRQQLERSWQKGQRKSWTQQLQIWGAKAVSVLTQGKEPKVSSVMTKAGMQWQVNDPVSNKTHTFVTETDVRAWLEQRYYQD